MKNLYLQLLNEMATNTSLVLATVTHGSGSTPQKPGCSALFGKTGLISGTVGGGVVEGKVHELALNSIQSGNSGHFHFNLASDISNKEEAICGGKVSVLIDANLRNHIRVFDQMRQSLKERIPGVLVTMVTDYSENIALINRYWMTLKSEPVLPPEFHVKIKPVADSMLMTADPSDYREMELSVPGEEPSSLFFLEPVFLPSRLIIAGAGHIGKALAHLGKLLDFEVTIIDDRPDYANLSNIPDADHIRLNDIGKELKDITKDSDTYVVIVTRGHKDDAAALMPCMGEGLAYVGMIGSKKKVAAMRENFIENGWATEMQWDQIYSPIGLPIESRTVEEIAVSIAAQLVLVRNSK